jgi:hypothetical protein
MLKHSRKLLLLAALCWVGPLSAQQHPPASEPARWHSKGCPHERAEAVALSGSDAVGEVSVFDTNRRAFFP